MRKKLLLAAAVPFQYGSYIIIKENGRYRFRFVNLTSAVQQASLAWVGCIMFSPAIPVVCTFFKVYFFISAGMCLHSPTTSGTCRRK